MSEQTEATVDRDEAIQDIVDALGDVSVDELLTVYGDVAFDADDYGDTVDEFRQRLINGIWAGFKSRPSATVLSYYQEHVDEHARHLTD